MPSESLPESAPPRGPDPLGFVRFPSSLRLIAMTLVVRLLREVGPREAGTGVDAHE